MMDMLFLLFANGCLIPLYYKQWALMYRLIKNKNTVLPFRCTVLIYAVKRYYLSVSIELPWIVIRRTSVDSLE